MKLLGSFILLFALPLLLVPLNLYAEDPQVIDITVHNGDKLTVRIPASWEQKVIQPNFETPPTLRVKSAETNIALQITFIPDLEGRFGSKEFVDQTVITTNQRFVEGAVEKKLELIQIESKQVRGSYSIFTDADLVNKTKLAKGEFVKVTTGVFVIGKEACAFTLLSNDTSSEEYKLALKIIAEGISIP